MAMKAKTVVFLGSTLPVAEARLILDADYRPPVKRGDIDALWMKRRPPAIAIIDGEFFQSLAISPKEILRSIERGVPLWGASSLGALRAAELYPFGMTGVGTVFEVYRSGRVIFDDEVSVAYSREHGRPVSEAMINIRVALNQARREGIVGTAVARRLISQARAMYFPDRSWPALWHRAESWLPANDLRALRQYIARVNPDVKRDDARLLLHQMKRQNS
jgi:TfuA protein